ncbi:MAG: hypothetical protein ACE5F6_00215 [Anaerolineae bacterium]
MENQKLPLFGGIITPLHNGADPILGATPIGGPVDKTLPRGTQATYEVHLWIVPSTSEGATRWGVFSAYDSDLTTVRPIAQGVIPAGNTYPVKVLDGFPMRGDVSFATSIVMNDSIVDLYPNGAQAYGYAYRVGRGDVIEPERRFIGDPSPDGISAGVPLTLAAGAKVPLHVFERDRFDDIFLGFTVQELASMKLYFEDASGVPVVDLSHYVEFVVPVFAEGNYLRDPQSIYTIKGAVFGGNAIFPNLHRISIECDKIATVYGHFSRR